jgi:hypothetical protein
MLCGPFDGQAAWAELGHPVWAQVIGVGSTLASFGLFYFLDRRLERTSASPARG